MCGVAILCIVHISCIFGTVLSNSLASFDHELVSGSSADTRTSVMRIFVFLSGISPPPLSGFTTGNVSDGRNEARTEHGGCAGVFCTAYIVVPLLNVFDVR